MPRPYFFSVTVISTGLSDDPVKAGGERCVELPGQDRERVGGVERLNNPETGRQAIGRLSALLDAFATS